MKTIFTASLIIFFFAGILLCQTKSNITFDAGTNIIIQTGTDICADTIIFNGTYTINGTICGHSIGIKPIASKIPDSYNLYQNFPNPFNPVTKIKFAIPLSRGVSEGRGVLVKITIYDVLGCQAAPLVNEQLKPGTYEVEWDGSKYRSGVYFYKLIANEFTDTKKMILIK